MANPEIILTVRTESTYTVEGPLTVYIKRLSDGTLWIYGQKKIGKIETPLGEEGSTIHTKQILAPEQLDAIFERLRSIRIPPAPDFEMGCDGGFTELEIGGYSGNAHYRWWSVPPEGWQPLDSIAKDIIRLSGLWKRLGSSEDSIENNAE